jgi:hypothetical protein
VRGIPGEQDPANHHLGDPPLVEPVHGQPHDLVVVDDLADQRVDVSGGKVEVGGHLPVDAPHATGLGVHENLPAGVPRRVEVEPPLGFGEPEIGPNVGDEEPVGKGKPLEGEAEKIPNG